MKIDPRKYDIQRAKSMMKNIDIATATNMSLGWVAAQHNRIKNGKDLLPRTVGQFAAALNCNVEDLIADEPAPATQSDQAA